MIVTQNEEKFRAIFLPKLNFLSAIFCKSLDIKVKRGMFSQEGLLKCCLAVTILAFLNVLPIWQTSVFDG